MIDPQNIPIGFYSAWCDDCGCESLRKLGAFGCLVCDEQTLV
jgi:hypothetical protein